MLPGVILATRASRGFQNYTRIQFIKRRVLSASTAAHIDIFACRPHQTQYPPWGGDNRHCRFACWLLHPRLYKASWLVGSQSRRFRSFSYWKRGCYSVRQFGPHAVATYAKTTCDPMAPPEFLASASGFHCTPHKRAPAASHLIDDRRSHSRQ